MPAIRLSIGTYGDDVETLHRQLKEHGFDVPPSEVDRKFFGPGTREAVRTYQQRNGLKITGILDPETTAAIEQGIAQRSVHTSQTIGRLPSLGSPVPISSQPTGAGAGAEVSNTELPKEFQFLVRGQVKYRNGLPLVGIKVRAFNKDLRSEDLLGETQTDSYGNFEIWYAQQQFRRPEKKNADLVVRAYALSESGRGDAQAETVLIESPIIFSAQTVEKVRLQVDGGPQTTWSEYEQLIAELEPLLEGAAITDLNENEQQQDISLLGGQTGQEHQRIAALVIAHKLAAKTNISPEIFYGLARQNLTTNLSELLAQSAETQRNALQQAISDLTIPGSLVDNLDQIQAQLRQAAVQYAVTPLADGTKTPISILLSTALPTTDQQAEFLNKYVNYRGAITTFWEQLDQESALKPYVSNLQTTFQLAALTGNHLPLVQALQLKHQANEFIALRDLARYTQQDWEQMIRNLPVPEEQRLPYGIPGQTLEEKTTVYAATLHRIIEDAFPTEAIAHKIQNDESQSQDVKTFFGNIISRETGFDLQRTPIQQFLEDHSDLLEGITDLVQLTTRVEAIQRVSNLTPRYDQLKLLNNAGMDSAYAIAQFDKDTFVHRFKPLLGSKGLTELIYEKAAYTAGAALNLFTNYSPLFNSLGMRVLQVPNKHAIPNLEALFGSMDLCQCEHCRSVYGPAAYFAEILAFLHERKQQKKLANGTKISFSVREKLFERRPDLGEIELIQILYNAA